MNERNSANLFAASVISLIIFATVALLRITGSLQTFELLAYDTAISWQDQPSSNASNIVLVKITEEDIRFLGGWPINDRLLTSVIQKVAQQNPRAIGLDIYRDVPVPPGTDDLNNILNQNETVIAIYKFNSEHSPGIDPPAVLNGTERIGFSDIIIDIDGVVRRGLAFLNNEEQFGYSFSLRLALAFLAPLGEQLKPAAENESHFALGPVTYSPLTPNYGSYVDADSGGYQYMIDFNHNSHFPSFTLQQVLSNAIPLDRFTDRVVIIGVDAVSVKDTFSTPQKPINANTSLTTPGMTLHAVMTNQLILSALQGHAPRRSLTDAYEFLLLLLFSVFAGLCGLYCRSVLRLFFFGVLGVVIACILGLALFRANIWIPMVQPALAWLITLTFVTAYLVQRERRERSLMQQMFAAQTSPEVAETLWARRSELLVEGRFRPQALEVTVLFIDLGGFTGVSEQLEANDLMEWIHGFMAVATDEIAEHGGVVDDYFGDGIKANFGVPFARTSPNELRADAQAAVSCALALTKKIAKLNRDSPRSLPYILRAGIHSGPVVLGGLGTRKRQKYTSIGDTVNIAARLEGLGKELSTQPQSSIIISGDTANLIGSQFILHDHNEVLIRGRKVPIRVFEVLSVVIERGKNDND